MAVQPAYCWKSGKRSNGRPKCILLSGHLNACQTTTAPKEEPKQ